MRYSVTQIATAACILGLYCLFGCFDSTTGSMEDTPGADVRPSAGGGELDVPEAEVPADNRTDPRSKADELRAQPKVDGEAGARHSGGRVNATPQPATQSGHEETNEEATSKNEHAPSDHAPQAPLSDLFEEPRRFSASEIPTNGLENRHLANLDIKIRQFMVKTQIPCVTFALSKNGQLLHDRAFGWGTREMNTPLQVGVPMELASLTKPIVKAGFRHLVAEQRLSLDEKLFDVLELDRWAPQRIDERWRQITIEMLLQHKSGLPRGASKPQVVSEFGVSAQDLKPKHIVQYHLERRLEYDPGTESRYSNFGYMLLARVMEKASHEDEYVTYLKKTVAANAGMETLRTIRAMARNRELDDTWYCMHPDFKTNITRTEGLGGAGALGCSAADYCRFLEHYSILSGERRVQGRRYNATFFGSSPGALSVGTQRPDEIVYTVICNRRVFGFGKLAANLKEMIDAEVNGVASQLH